MNREIKNARIERTSLGIEDHGIFTADLWLDYGGSGQVFGGYALDEPIKKDGKFIARMGTAYGMQKIMDLLKCLGKTRWEDLPGTYVRVDSEHTQVHRIGHLLEDKWFTFEEGQ